MRAHEPGVRRNSFEPCVACWGAGVSRGRAGQFLGGTLPRWDSEATSASAHAQQPQWGPRGLPAGRGAVWAEPAPSLPSGPWLVLCLGREPRGPNFTREERGELCTQSLRGWSPCLGREPQGTPPSSLFVHKGTRGLRGGLAGSACL